MSRQGDKLNIRHDDDFRTLSDKVPEELYGILKKCLGINEAQYESLEFLNKDLTSFLNRNYLDFTCTDLGEMVDDLVDDELSYLSLINEGGVESDDEEADPTMVTITAILTPDSAKQQQEAAAARPTSHRRVRRVRRRRRIKKKAG